MTAPEATTEFGERFLHNLPYEPTRQQYLLIAALSRFMTMEALPGANRVFLINGFAGTGKTSVVGALVKTLGEYHVPTVLLAPTGRAAKVFGSMAGHRAYTIHRRIYRMPGAGVEGAYASLNVNSLSNAVFIVDEASMIGGDDSAHTSSLLNDLLQYVYSGNNSRLILMGDTAQLPPVGHTESPAMNVDKLKSYGLTVSRAVITETVRQRGDSGILANATRLRQSMKLSPIPKPRFSVKGHLDVEAVEGSELIDTLASAYSRDGVENTILITRSNRSATAANLTVRNRIFYSEEELVKGERLMVAKNNYLWAAKHKELDFIANGDMVELAAVHSTETKDGLRFADVTLHFPDHDIDLDCKIMLDSLTSESASIEPERWHAFGQRRLMDPMLFALDSPMSYREKVLRSDPWVNALQVKYAYAVTCHKAQGGQWKNVFVDTSGASSPMLVEEAKDDPDAPMRDVYRWLYTAFTRATTRLYLINPPEEALC